jgi:hypothetical protein
MAVQNAMTPAQTQAANLQKLQANNLAARQFVLANAINAWQQTFQQTYTSGAGTVVSVPLRNVGLQKRVMVQVAATVSGSSGPTHTLTTLGASTFFSNVLLTDLSNQTRINTPSWHLTAVASAKRKQPFGSAIKAASLDSPFGFGASYVNTIFAPSTITASAASNNVFTFFEVPITYSDTDLRGGIYANVVNATYNLQLTVNPSLLVATGVDASFSMYQSSTSTVATLPSFTVTLFQNYLDQIPNDLRTGAPILPALDISTAYLFNQTQFGGLVVNTPNPLPYPNYRDILSTTVIYDDNSALLTGKVTPIQIQTANYTNLINVNEQVVSLWNRNRMQDDFPPGVYYLDHRDRPISTVAFGNMALNLTPTTVTGASSAFYVAYEMLTIINQVTNAGSLAGT